MTAREGCRPEPTLEQQQVIEHMGSPLLVLAGPGTGKTTVLALRILFLLEEMRIPQDHILAVTFTTKAAQEMRDRLVAYRLPEEQHPWIATLHAVAARILHGHAPLVGLPNDFHIANKCDSQLVFGDACFSVVGRTGHSPERPQKRDLRQRFDQSRYAGLAPSAVTDGQVRSLRHRYARLCLFYKACDLDGLILGALGVLRGHPDVLEQYRRRARFLLVDEYQDVNGGQHELLKLLVGNSEAVFAVGDDDQSIYSWRGGDPRFILSFSNSFPGGETKVLTLSQRCPEHILHAACAVISKNKSRVDKDIRSCGPAGERIHILTSKSENAEARWIAEWIKERVDRQQHKSSDISVLSTDPAISKLAYDEVRKRGVQAVRRTTSLLDSVPVWRVVSLLRLAVNPKDNLAVRTCLTEGPVRGLGPKAVHTIQREAEQTGQTLWNAISTTPPAFSKWRKRLKDFVQYVEQLAQDTQTMSTAALIKRIAGDLAMAEEESVVWLVTQAEQAPEDCGAAAFLERLQRCQGLDVTGETPGKKDDGVVQFFTMHLVKGLEAETVFVIGLEEGLFPDPREDLEEQRRLFFVAMTRAKKELFLCTSKMRKARGFNFYAPSPFMGDIPSAHVQHIENH